MKDFFDRELKIDDVVAFERPRYRELVKGTVVGFTPQQVRVEWYDGKYAHAYLTPPTHLIKRDI
jgi:hypothetical protein